MIKTAIENDSIDNKSWFTFGVDATMTIVKNMIR